VRRTRPRRPCASARTTARGVRGGWAGERRSGARAAARNSRVQLRRRTAEARAIAAFSCSIASHCPSAWAPSARSSSSSAALSSRCFAKLSTAERQRCSRFASGAYTSCRRAHGEGKRQRETAADTRLQPEVVDARGVQQQVEVPRERQRADALLVQLRVLQLRQRGEHGLLQLLPAARAGERSAAFSNGCAGGARGRAWRRPRGASRAPRTSWRPGPARAW